VNIFWWTKLLRWMWTGKWEDLTCPPCTRGIHMHDDVKTKRCITKGCDCVSKEE
jgi:hypothetical protein